MLDLSTEKRWFFINHQHNNKRAVRLPSALGRKNMQVSDKKTNTSLINNTAWRVL